MKDKIDQAMLRTKQYWYVDGLTEMSFGGICLILSLYFLAQATLPGESLLYKILDYSFALILVGAGLLAGRIVTSLKTRLTYPRTGYVAYRQVSGRRRWIIAVAAVLTGGLLAALLASTPIALAWMPAASGLLIGAAWLYLGMQIGPVRFFWLAAFSLLAGSGIALLGVENILGLGLYYGLIGLALILSGGSTLRSYLRETQPAAEEIE